MEPDLRVEPDGPEFNLFDYIGIVRKHLHIILGCSVAGCLLALLLWFITPPQYRANVRMKMSHMSRDVLGFGQDFWWNPYRDEFFKTEFQIIRSLPVAKKVVETLGPDYFEPTPSKTDENTSIASMLLDKASTDSEAPPSDRNRFLEARATGLLGMISVDLIRDTNLVTITCTSKDPEMARDLANTWARAYITHDLETKYKKNWEAYNFLVAKAEELQEKIDESVRQISQFSQDQNIVTLGESRATMDDATLSKMNDSLVAKESELHEMQSQYEQLRASEPGQSAPVIDHPIIKDLTAQLAQKQSDYQRNLQTYKPQAPRMVELKSEISSLESELAQQKEKVYRQLINASWADVLAKERELTTLRASFERQRKQSAQSRMVTGSQIESMRSKVEVMRRQLENLELKKEDLELALDLKDYGRSDKLIVEEARLPAAPFAPNLKRFLVVGCFLGLFAAAGLVFLLEITDRKIHTTDMLERLTGLPTLATIPAITFDSKDHRDRLERRKEMAMLTHTKPTSPLAETYRHLRTNIQLSRTTQNRVFLVSSAVSGEGKTVSSTNLAIAFAQLEKNVLLIDCDLRRPKIHRLFDISNKFGIVNMLVNNEAPKKCISRSEIPFLDVLPSGPLPPNPAELLASQRMGHFVGEVKKHYEYVVFDSSPLLAVTDASLLGQLVDGIIFVTKASSTLREDAGRALALLHQNQLTPLGTILNDYDYSRGRKYYGYRYGYGRYGYGRGYGGYGYGHYGPHEYQAEEKR